VDADNQGVSPGKRGHTNVKRKFRARAVGITTLGVDGIVAEKGTDPLTAWKGSPLGFEKYDLSRY